jgi:hypothetical protein
MTHRAVLLWAIAALLALALAYWDYESQSSAPRTEAPPGPEDVEIEVVYEGVE